MSDEKKYVGSEALIRLVAQLKAGFATLTHKHTLSDITDYVVDSSLSADSTNPVQNQALKAEFDEVQSALDAKVSATDLESGDIEVAEATHAASADSATNATNAINATNANHATTADSATSADSATTATKATQDASGNVITETYETKSDADATEEALTSLINGKANASHTHTIANVTNLQSELDEINSAIEGKADSSHSHSAATQSAAGFMSASDKTKLDGIAAGANAYTLPSAGTDLGGVKSGGDVTISGGVITVNDDSHAHVIANVDGLQDALNAKAAASHDHDDVYYTQDEIDSTVSSLNTAIAGKAASSHTHAISEVTNLQSSLDAKVPTSRTVNGKALTANITLSASDVGADASGAASDALASANAYTDSEIANLLENSTEAIDSIYELRDAMNDNADAITALQSLAASKANASDLTSHTGDTTVHITATERSNWNAAKTHADSAHAPSDAEKNQNAFSNVTVGSTTIAADSATDTLTFIAGSNVTLTPNATNDSVTIAATDTVYTHPSSGVTAGTYKSVTVNAQGHVTGGTNPTTLSGYGITDAAAKSHTHTISEISDLTATAAELNKLDGVTATTAELNILDGVTATAAEINKLDGLTASTTELNYVKGVTSAIQTQLNAKASSSHTHNYAGSSSAGGSATSAVKLDSSAGSATQPVYFSDGKPVATTYALNKTVPSDAKFTDTTYSAATTSAAGLMSAADKAKMDYTNVAYGTCDTAAATAAKVVTISGNSNWTLGVGSIVVVSFGESNSASSVTLNVNGTGAYPIWYNNAEYTSTGTAYCGYAGRAITYMFNGTHWVWLTGSYDANTTYTNVKLGQGYATCSTAAATTAKVGTLSGYTLVTGGIVAVKFTYAVPAGSTLNINSKGAKAIYYKGKAIVDGVICAGDVATFIYNGSQYHLLTIDRNRFFTTLVPYGTQITTEGTDLNTIDLIKVGNYFCSANATAKTLINCPTQVAFMMQVYSPLTTTVDDETTNKYAYRVRKLLTYTGEEYISRAYTSGTAGTWNYTAWERVVTTTNTSGVAQIADGGTGATTAAAARANLGAASMFGYTATSTDGVAYTATVDGITELVAGIHFTIVPNMTSTSVTPTLNVNGLGAAMLRTRVSGNTATTAAAVNANWLSTGKPVEVVYDGRWWMVNFIRPNAPDLYGTVAIANGGTGATTAETARTNLEVYSKSEVDNLLSGAGGSVQFITWESTD